MMPELTLTPTDAVIFLLSLMDEKLSVALTSPMVFRRSMPPISSS